MKLLDAILAGLDGHGSERRSAGNAALRRSRPDPGKKNLAVLVIEDEDHDYAQISRLCRKLDNYNVTTFHARNYDQADLLLRARLIDLVFVDYRLGAERGTDVMKSLHAQYPNAVQILVSGHSNETIQCEALSSGALYCISKFDLSARLLETTMRCALHAPHWQNSRWVH